MVIRVINLTKVYDNKVKALDNVSFSYDKKGSVLTIIGSNGAGKTTLMRILAGQLLPTSGEAYVLGFNVVKEFNRLKRKIAFLPQDIRAFFYTLTPRDYIFSYLLMRGYSIGDAHTLTARILDEMGLKDVASIPVMKLSGGTVKRVFLSMVFAVEDAEVYFLDEPYTGVDVRARIVTWNIMRRIAKEGKTVIVASHYLEEVSTISDHVLVMNRGRIIVEGSPSELLASFFRGVSGKIVIKDVDIGRINNILIGGDANTKIITVGDTIFIYTADIRDLSSKLVNLGLKVEIAPLGLEDIVINLGASE
ncbi:MAG: ABC transporter ATP-binding protein [Sulfolobales archaeon]